MTYLKNLFAPETKLASARAFLLSNSVAAGLGSFNPNENIKMVSSS
jgi:hypothetical protein